MVRQKSRNSSRYYTYLAPSPSAPSPKFSQHTPVTNANEPTRRRTICAVRTKDGVLQWCQPLPAGFLPSAGMSQGIVYAPGLAQGLDAIRTSDGKILWHILANVSLDDADTVLL
ncbi:MAG TPA: hypothetical protein VFV38_33400 [Ktedonobacteraceae bacterium]|nr:hypothetical protein [Ktedonobacteraceae bacterium]